MPVSAFDAYLHANPDAFVAIDTGKGDFFCAAANLEPCVMSIDAVETKQFDYAKTVGHKPFDLSDAMAVATEKLNSGAPQIVIPMYIKPSYAEQNCKSS